MIIFAVILTAIDFALSKLYQKRHGSSMLSGLKFNFFVGLFSSIIFLIINKFKVEITLFSSILAVVMTIVAIFYINLGFVIIANGKTSYYAFFKSMGAMLVPYMWGLLYLKEKPSAFNVIGLVLIAASIYLMNSDMGKIKIKIIILCSIVFIAAGVVSIISKEHSINTNAVSPIGYVLLTSFVKVIFCGGLYLLLKWKSTDKYESKKDYGSLSLLCAASALLTGISYMIQLNFAKDMPATLLYPILTGGTIVATTLFAGLFFKEKLTIKGIFSVIICFVGTFMFA